MIIQCLDLGEMKLDFLPCVVCSSTTAMLNAFLSLSAFGIYCSYLRLTGLTQYSTVC